MVQIIEIAHGRRSGNGCYKGLLLPKFPFLMVLSKLGTGLSSKGDDIAVDSIRRVPPSPAGKLAFP